MLKTTYEKEGSKQIVYCQCKNIEWGNFQNDLEYALNGCNNNVDKYQECFVKVLDTHAPLRVKYTWENRKPHLTKTFRKYIMKISRLKFKANLTRNPTDIKNYRTQRDVAVKLNCQST